MRGGPDLGTSLVIPVSNFLAERLGARPGGPSKSDLGLLSKLARQLLYLSTGRTSSAPAAQFTSASEADRVGWVPHLGPRERRFIKDFLVRIQGSHYEAAGGMGNATD